MTMIVPDKTRAIISLIMLAFILFYMVSLFFFNIPTENKDLVNILLGAVVGILSASIIAFCTWIVTSGSEQNQQIIELHSHVALLASKVTDLESEIDKGKYDKFN